MVVVAYAFDPKKVLHFLAMALGGLNHVEVLTLMIETLPFCSVSVHILSIFNS